MVACGGHKQKMRKMSVEKMRKQMRAREAEAGVRVQCDLMGVSGGWGERAGRF